METLYATPSGNFTLTFDRNKNLFVCTMSGMIEAEEYKKSFNTFLDIYPYDLVPSVMFNNVNLNQSPATGRAWFASYVVPEFRRRLGDETRLKKMAVAQPKNLFQNTVTKVLYKTARQMGIKLNVEFFNTYEDALAWMEKK